MEILPIPFTRPDNSAIARVAIKPDYFGGSGSLIS